MNCWKLKSCLYITNRIQRRKVHVKQERKTHIVQHNIYDKKYWDCKPNFSEVCPLFVFENPGPVAGSGRVSVVGRIWESTVSVWWPGLGSSSPSSLSLSLLQLVMTLILSSGSLLVRRTQSLGLFLADSNSNNYSSSSVSHSHLVTSFSFCTVHGWN